MFEKPAIEALFDELDDRHKGTPDYDQLLRDAHLAIALSDAAKPLDDEIDARIVALVEKHRTTY